jgi:hypothetical protein
MIKSYTKPTRPLDFLSSYPKSSVDFNSRRRCYVWCPVGFIKRINLMQGSRCTTQGFRAIRANGAFLLPLCSRLSTNIRIRFRFRPNVLQCNKRKFGVQSPCPRGLALGLRIQQPASYICAPIIYNTNLAWRFEPNWLHNIEFLFEILSWLQYLLSVAVIE